MSTRFRLSSFVRNLFHRDRVEQDLDDELHSYLELAADEHRRAGLPEDEAQRAARVELQGLDQVKERVRDARAGALIEQLRRDVAFGLRMLSRNRGFTIAAVATLGIGIGAGTATFTIVDTVVFRPLPYKDPERLVRIWGRGPTQPEDVSLPDFSDIRDQNHVFEEIAADDGMDFKVVYGGSRRSVLGAMVTADWLSTLGIQPVLGRRFLPEEMQPGRDRVVILTDVYWRRHFGSDPSIVGRSLSVDGEHCTILGVLPPNILRYGADFLKPLVAASYPPGRGHRDLDVFARLRPGVTIERAQSEIDAIARRMALEYPATNNGHGFRLVALGKSYASINRRANQGLVLMLGAVALVLLIACVNVANLLLARAVARGRECVIRAALGASRMRLVRQLLVENVLLFLVGGALGSLLAWWLVDALRLIAVAQGYVPDRLAIALDGRVLLVSLSVSLLTGLAFGLIPALHASRVDLNQGLRDSSPTSVSGSRRTRARHLLIVSELVLSLVLLVGFGLLIRSFIGLRAVAAGVTPDGLIETLAEGGREFAPAVAFWQRTLDHARVMPGVQLAAVSSRPPVHGSRQQQFAVEGRGAATRGEEARAGDILISADYFRVMGIPLLKGRPFTEQDTESAPPVVIISQTLARRYFPDEDPLGRRILINERAPMTCCASGGRVEGVWRQIVGVVADIRQANLDEEPASTMYRPYTQIVEHDMYLLVRARSASDETRIAANLTAHLRGVDPAKEWFDVRTMRQVIAESGSIRLRRFVLILLGSFSALALLLAAVGLYGVMAYFVVERRREIGIRVALGATRPVVLAQVLAEAMRLALAGVVLGAVAAYFLTRMISTLLFGIAATDAITYLAVSALLVVVALMASYLPARRAARLDPIVVLREM